MYNYHNNYTFMEDINVLAVTIIACPLAIPITRSCWMWICPIFPSTRHRGSSLTSQ